MSHGGLDYGDHGIGQHGPDHHGTGSMYGGHYDGSVGGHYSEHPVHVGSLDFGHGGQPGLYDMMDGHDAPEKVILKPGAGGIEVVVKSHGAIDVKRLFKSVASQLSLVAIDDYRPNLLAEDPPVRLVISDFEAPGGRTAPPSGWYPGAHGETRIWKEFWQEGKRSFPLAFWEPLKPNFKPGGSYLEIFCITWFFKEAGDFQTYMQIQVQSLPVWSMKQQRWGHNQSLLELHRTLANRIGVAVAGQLNATKPIASAAGFRERLWRLWRLEGGQDVVAQPPKKNDSPDQGKAPRSPRHHHGDPQNQMPSQFLIDPDENFCEE